MNRSFQIRNCRFLICSAVLLCGIASTWAYFTHGRILDNGFWAGTNTIEIQEEYDPPKTLSVGENVFRKRVQVENTGTVPCFVRVFADFSDYEIREISEISPNGTDYYPADEFEEHMPVGWIRIHEEEDELLGGFYYYTEALEPDEVTVSLFEKIRCTFKNADEIQPFDILISAESVQTRDCLGQVFEGGDAFRQAWTEYLERR